MSWVPWRIRQWCSLPVPSPGNPKKAQPRIVLHCPWTFCLIFRHIVALIGLRGPPGKSGSTVIKIIIHDEWTNQVSITVNQLTKFSLTRKVTETDHITISDGQRSVVEWICTFWIRVWSTLPTSDGYHYWTEKNFTIWQIFVNQENSPETMRKLTTTDQRKRHLITWWQTLKEHMLTAV